VRCRSALTKVPIVCFFEWRSKSQKKRHDDQPHYCTNGLLGQDGCGPGRRFSAGERASCQRKCFSSWKWSSKSVLGNTSARQTVTHAGIGTGNASRRCECARIPLPTSKTPPCLDETILRRETPLRPGLRGRDPSSCSGWSSFS